jgi:hypothetical protein
MKWPAAPIFFLADLGAVFEGNPQTGECASGLEPFGSFWQRPCAASGQQNLRRFFDGHSSAPDVLNLGHRRVVVAANESRSRAAQIDFCQAALMERKS